MNEAEAVDAGVASIFFDECCYDLFPEFKALTVFEAVIEHHMMTSPYFVSCRVELFEFVGGADQAVRLQECMLMA